MTLRESVAQAMQAQGVTQAELSRRTGISTVQLSRWLCGHNAMQDRRVDRVMAALGLQVGPCVPPQPAV